MCARRRNSYLIVIRCRRATQITFGNDIQLSRCRENLLFTVGADYVRKVMRNIAHDAGCAIPAPREWRGILRGFAAFPAGRQTARRRPVFRVAERRDRRTAGSRAPVGKRSDFVESCLWETSRNPDEYIPAIKDARNA